MTTMTDDEPVTDADFEPDPDEPDLPPEPPATEPGEAPYGLTVDRQTGTLRPKMKPGRPRKPATADELRAAGPPPPAVPDDPPGKVSLRKRQAPADDLPMPKGGVIAAGVNKLYRRAGKIVRAMDHDIGTAIIECAQDGDPDSVGVAWENLAKTNPKIRAWLVKAVAGGLWGDLVMAHAPIGMAIVMKPAIAKRIPFRKIALSLAEPDEDSPDGDFGGLGEADLEQMAQRMGMDVEQMKARAEEVMADIQSGKLPPGARTAPPGFRQQPRNKSRAQRTRAK